MPTAAERRSRARLSRAERRAEKKRASKIAAEVRAEDLAPAVARIPIVGHNGVVLRGPRVVVFDGRIEPASTIRNLAMRQARRSDKGGEPSITAAHVKAAERLLQAHREVGEGIGTASAAMGSVRSGIAASGITEGRHRSLVRQLDLVEELRGARASLGPLFGVLDHTVIRGIDVAAWAAIQGMNRTMAVGFLAAALTMLATFHTQWDARVKPSRGRLNTARVQRHGSEIQCRG